jgi:hypothetical protein
LEVERQGAVAGDRGAQLGLNRLREHLQPFAVHVGILTGLGVGRRVPSAASASR